MTTTALDLAPRLVVPDGEGDNALAFYATVFESTATDQAYDGTRLVNGHVQIGETLMGVTEADGSLNRCPQSVGGSPVILSVSVPDVDAVADRFVNAGGEVLISIADRPYGRRDGRLRDPFGHLWILGQPTASTGV